MRSLPRDFSGIPLPCRGCNVATAVNQHLCWICSQKLGQYAAFLIDPVSCLTRLATAPPNHRECALYVAQDPRKTDYLSVVWITKAYAPQPDGKGGTYFVLDAPSSVFWFIAGRQATRAEAHGAIDKELPALLQIAAGHGPRYQKMLAFALDDILRKLPLHE